MQNINLPKANHISHALMKPKFYILIQFDGVITEGQKVGHSAVVCKVNNSRLVYYTLSKN